MKVLLQKYGITLIVAGVILSTLLLIPNSESRYLNYELRSIRMIADGVVLGLIGLLVLIAITIKFRTLKQIKDRFQYLVGYTLFGIALFFILRNFFLPLMMLLNQSITHERESLDYKLVNKGSNYDLLLDLAKNRAFLVEDDQRPSIAQELHTGDTIVAKFKKGLLGVNFDPEFSKK